MSTISASTASNTAFKVTSDTTGTLVFQTGAVPTTAISIDASQVVSIGNIAVTGATTFAAGSAAAPSITTTGDTNTGIFFPAADTIAFTEGGVEAARFDSSGNLGIGTTSPTFATGGGVQAKNSTFVSFRASGGSSTGIDFSQDSAGNGYVFNRDNASVVFGTNNTESMRLTSTGLGIGTTSPATKLGVNGGIQILAGNALYFQNAAADANGTISGAGGSGSNALSFNSGAAYLDASGNLGINTSSPSTFGKVAIQVTGTTTPTNAANVGPSSINLYAATNGGSTNGTTGIFGWSAGSPGIGSGIGFSRESSADWGSQIRFYTHPTATTNIGDITERARITSDGNLLVGTTTAYAKLAVVTAANQPGLYVATAATGQDSFSFNCSATTSVYGIGLYSSATAANTVALFRGYHTTSTQCFNIAGSGNVTNTNNSYGAISDVKLKENIVDASPKLNDLMQVKVRNYNFKEEPTHKQIGVIAQELEAIFPSMVEETLDYDLEGNNLGTTTKAVKYSVFVPILIKAIQELEAKFADLESK